MRERVRKYSLWWYYALSVAIVLIALLAVTWYMADRFRDFFVDQQRSELEIYSSAIKLDVEKNGMPVAGINELCNTHRSTDETLRMTLIDTGGLVLCDSVGNPAEMDNHSQRPEIISAFQGKTGSSLRYSNTVKASMLYVAVPLHTDGVGRVFRVSRSLAAIDALLSEVFGKMLAVLVFLVAAIFLVSLYLYRIINPPLHEIRQGAERYAGGNFDRMLPDYQVREISDLASAMNQMATRLDSLENLRQEFVANVSHELKTPVTTIKGFAETSPLTSHDPFQINCCI